jgi:hypothetical protein
VHCSLARWRCWTGLGLPFPLVLSGMQGNGLCATEKNVKKSGRSCLENVPDLPDYEVSEYGDVRRGLKKLKASREPNSGRKRVCLSRGGRKFWFHAAHLVAFAFVGPRPFKLAELCHNDGFEHNNHFSNLRWDTQIGNAADRVKHKIQRDGHSSFPIPRQRILSAEATQFLADRQATQPSRIRDRPKRPGKRARLARKTQKSVHSGQASVA